MTPKYTGLKELKDAARYEHIIVCALFILSATVAQGATRAVDKLQFPKLKDLSAPQVDTFTLSNGLRVYLLEDHLLPTINISARLKIGSYLEPADKVGLAELTGIVMRTGGTSSSTGDEIDEKLEKVGAAVESNIGLTEGSASANALIEYADLVLSTMTAVLSDPAFDEDKLTLAKTQFRAGIARRNDDPEAIAERIFKTAIYGKESPYARIAEYATVDAITRDDLRAFHRRFVHPKNVQLAVWGDFNKAEMLTKIKTHFGAWSATGEVAPAPPDPQPIAQSSKVYYAPKTDVNQTNIYVGGLGHKLTDPDYPTRTVMSNVMGGGFGGRLFANVRTRKGLAYNTYGGDFAQIDRSGEFFGFASTKSETSVQAVREVVAQISSMTTTPPSEIELRRAVDGYLNSFVFKFDTRAEVIQRLVQYDAHGIDPNFLNQVKDKIGKVSPTMVNELAKKDIKLDQLQYVVVGNGKDFDSSLAVLGLPVDTVDISIPSGEKKAEVAQTPENTKKGWVILNAAITASGGIANFKKIKSFERKTDLTIHAQGQSMSVTQTELVEFPNRMSTTTQTPVGARVDIFDGIQGWRSFMGKKTPMAEGDLKEQNQRVQRSLISLFRRADKADYTPVWGGRGEIEGTAVDNLHIFTNEGQELLKLSCDAETALPLAVTYFGPTMSGPGELALTLSDYRPVGGIKYPYLTKTTTNGQPFAEGTVTSLVINPTIPAESFAEPK